MDSIWKCIKNPIPEISVTDYMETDVAIIGGGMAGMLTAYQLKNSGLKVIVIDKSTIGQGVTGNSTAKITSQHGLHYTHLIKNAGAKAAKQYARYNQQAIKQFESIIHNEHISCHFERQDGYLYDTTEASFLMEEVSVAKSLSIPAEFITNPSLPFPTKGAVVFPNQAQFNPLEFLYGISKDIEIYQNTTALEVKRDKITILNNHSKEQHTLKARHIVVATHYPFINFPGLYFLRMYQSCSYVLVLKHVKPVDGMYIGTSDKNYSLRNYEDILLFGGGRHRTGILPDTNPYDTLRKAVHSFYPEAIEIGHWSAQDCMPLRQIPYIGRYAKGHDHLYLATGFQKWGMTGSMVAATLISKQIQTPVNTLDTLFSPQSQQIKEDLIPIVKNLSVSMRNLIFPRKGPRCTHMGCSLKWNPYEHTWDCACHGSKFHKNGRIMSNPAKKELYL